MEDDYVTASAFGDWLYCRRQWWYSRRGKPTLAAPLLDRGSATHAVVALQARRLERLRAVAVWLIVASVACLVLIGLFLLNNR